MSKPRSVETVRENVSFDQRKPDWISHTLGSLLCALEGRHNGLRSHLDERLALEFNHLIERMAGAQRAAEEYEKALEETR